MNHATTLRHSRAHRDAAKRIASQYVTRVTIETSKNHAYLLLVCGLPKGVRLVSKVLAKYGCVCVLVVDIDPGYRFVFDPIDFEIIKTERVRK